MYEMDARARAWADAKFDASLVLKGRRPTFRKEAPGTIRQLAEVRPAFRCRLRTHARQSRCRCSLQLEN